MSLLYTPFATGQKGGITEVDYPYAMPHKRPLYYQDKDYFTAVEKAKRFMAFLKNRGYKNIQAVNQVDKQRIIVTAVSEW